jgi:hypothetical protein
MGGKQYHLNLYQVNCDFEASTLVFGSKKGHKSTMAITKAAWGRCEPDLSTNTIVADESSKVIYGALVFNSDGSMLQPINFEAANEYTGATYKEEFMTLNSLNPDNGIEKTKSVKVIQTEFPMLLYYAVDGSLAVGEWSIDVNKIEDLALFKYGSITGLTNPWGNTDTYSPDDVKFNPANVATTTFAEIPKETAVDITAAYHNAAANAAAGKGDPCRMVGWETGDPLPYDNGKWRLPTQAENTTFVGGFTQSSVSSGKYLLGKVRRDGTTSIEPSDTSMIWPTTNGQDEVGLAAFPASPRGKWGGILPAAGYRESTDGTQMYQGAWGMYTSSTMTAYPDYFYGVYFSSAQISTLASIHTNQASTIRCVRQ